MNWKRSILCLFVLAFLAAFPWGPLFAWSPIHPGYRQVQFSHADVLYPNEAALDPAYREVDRYVGVAESFHEVKCVKKIKIVVCRNWSDCLRFATPFLGKPLAVTIPFGTVIFVTPKAAVFRADIGELLRHELSHAVLMQHQSLVSVVRMRHQLWVSEGVAGLVAEMGATAPGRQSISLPKAKFLSRAKRQTLWPSFDAVPQKDWRFSYTASIYFWNRQIERSGKTAFLNFERACFSDPRGCRTTFGDVYGRDLRSAVDEFQAEVRSGRVTGGGYVTPGDWKRE
jgi:hypothetical protein